MTRLHIIAGAFGRFWAIAFGTVRAGFAPSLQEQSRPKALLTIARAFPERLAILACLAIWGGTFLAIWRL